MSKPLRVGIVGLGRIFDLHARAYENNPDARLVALCDTQDGLLASRGARFPDATRFSDLDAFLAHDLDLVEILTPHPLHRQMAIAAAAAGSAVSVQKPMAMTTGECDSMIEAARSAGSPLKLFENFVFYPPLVKARQLMNDGAIGKPHRLRMSVVIGSRDSGWHVPADTNAWRYELGSQDRGGPIFFDHGHHLMAVALWLFGDVRDGFARIETTTVREGVTLDAPATAMWRHREPSVHVSWDVGLSLNMLVRSDYYPSHEDFEIHGDEGILRVARCSDRLLDEPAVTLYRNGKVKSWHNLDADWGESFALSGRHFVNCLLGREPQIALTGEEGRRVIALFELLNRASREERAIGAESGPE